MAILQLGEAAGGAVRQHLPAVREINLNTETPAHTQSITPAVIQVSLDANVSPRARVGVIRGAARPATS